MKIQIISDTHLEWHKDKGVSFFNSLEPIGVDVLIIAGDFTSPYYLKESLESISKLYKQVVIICGNHDFYTLEKTYTEIIDEIRSISNQLGNISFLYNECVTIDGVKFAGTPLWFRHDSTDYTINKKYYKFHMHDFEYIKNFDEWVFKENALATNFILNTKADVFITHYAPSYYFITDQYKGNKFNSFFVTELFDYIHDSNIKYWFFGHMHTSFDTIINNTRMISNPFGYPFQLNPNYIDKLIISL